MRRAPRPRRPNTGAMRSAKATPIAMVAAANGTTIRPRRSDRSQPMRSVFTTWPEIFGSGCRIATTTATGGRPRTDQRGPAKFVIAVSFAAAPGSANPRFFAPPAGSGTVPTTGATFRASGLAGRLTLESLLPSPFGPARSLLDQGTCRSRYLERDTIYFDAMHAKLSLSGDLVYLPEKTRLSLVVVGIRSADRLKRFHIGTPQERWVE